MLIGHHVNFTLANLNIHLERHEHFVLVSFVVHNKQLCHDCFWGDIQIGCDGKSKLQYVIHTVFFLFVPHDFNNSD